MVEKLPFKEKQFSANTYQREFAENVDEDDLKWHYDEEDRLVESVEPTDWLIQMDNNLPQKFEGQFFIPKGVYHRIIKGTQNCVVKIIKK